MAYPKNVHVPGGTYLVSSIGERGKAVFVDDGDRISLGELVGKVVARCGARVHAYKWLEDEILMVVQVYDISLSGVMRRISSVHARRVNQKLGIRGNLFQHPHRATLLEDRVSVLEAIATVHRNPVDEWCGHRAYLGLEDVSWLTTQTVMDLLSDSSEEQIGAYAELMAGEESCQPSIRLLPRNAQRTRGSGAYDEFLMRRKLRSVEHSRPASLDELIQGVARWLQVAPEAIESGSTSPLLSLARALITWAAMQNGIASLADLARRFDRGRSTLHETREAYRVRVPQIFTIPLDEILAGPRLAASDVLRLVEAASSNHSCVRR